MNIFIATYGSRGDVEPYAALGKGLTASGHQVTLATSVRFKQIVEGLGLTYGYMSDTLLGIIDTPAGRDLLENTSGLIRLVTKSARLKKRVAPLQEALIRESWEAARAAAPDLILFHPKVFGAPSFAEKLGVPGVLALPIPMLVPTAARPHAGFPDPGLGPAYNRLTHRLVSGFMSVAGKAAVNTFRKSHGMPPLKRLDLLRRSDGSPVPVLEAFSPHVVQPPPDQPASVTTTGYWFLDTDESNTPDPALAAFLAQGPPPVYIGFGSMTGRNPKELAALAVEALTRAGVRGILATGWGGLRPETLPPEILAIDQAPHAWLFPRVAAVVHHGSAGTTAAALRAGRPSVVVPFFGDQPFWGQRIRDLNAGSAPIPRKKLTAANLAAAIRRVVSSPEISRAAKDLGRKIRREDGIRKAVRIIRSIK